MPFDGLETILRIVYRYVNLGVIRFKTSRRSQPMKSKLALILIFGAALAGCGAKKSQLVVLYKYSIEPGNSIVALVNYEDETGARAAGHCEKLKELYQAKDKIDYICSTITLDEFKPTIK